jgi:hypothetical protein
MIRASFQDEILTSFERPCWIRALRLRDSKLWWRKMQAHCAGFISGSPGKSS